MVTVTIQNHASHTQYPYRLTITPGNFQSVIMEVSPTAEFEKTPAILWANLTMFGLISPLSGEIQINHSGVSAGR